MKISNKAPFKEPISNKDDGAISRAWQQFFRLIEEVIKYLGDEFQQEIINNQAAALKIDDLFIDKSFCSFAIIDYVIQRVTSTTELVQSGCLHAVYLPSTLTWSVREYGTSGPSASGITFSITSLGQIKYTSSNVGGVKILSRMNFRIRKIAAKSNLYSKVG